MTRNIEIKARIESIADMVPKVAAIAENGPIAIIQDDTFFRCETGRLKLRTFSSQEGELIFYRRAHERGPKESFYICSQTSAPEKLREVLSQAYGQTGRVKKRRVFFLVGRTRIHLDDVEGLGQFLELEVVLGDGEPADNGIREAYAVMNRLGIQRSQLVKHAYVDLLGQKFE